MNVDPVLEPEPEQEPEPEPELEVEPQEEIIGHSEVVRSKDLTHLRNSHQSLPSFQIDDKADVYEIIIPNEEYEQGEEEEEDEKEFIITHGGEEVKEEDEHILIFEEELAEDDDDLIEELVDDSDQPLVKIEQKSRKKRQRKVREKKRPFVCDDCGKTWSTRGALKEHQIIHSGRINLTFHDLLIHSPLPGPSRRSPIPVQPMSEVLQEPATPSDPRGHSQ